MRDDNAKLWAAISFLFFLMAMLFMGQAIDAQEVKFCKNLTTGEIIVVEINYPCPYPTVRI